MSIQRWIDAGEEGLARMLFNPRSETEYGFLLAAGFLAMIVVLGRAGKAMGIPNTGLAYSFGVAVAGPVLLLASLVAARLYVDPVVPPQLVRWIPLATPILVSLLVIVPLMAAWQKTEYVSALITWAVGLAAAAAAVYVLHTILQAGFSGSKDVERMRGHNTEIHRVLEQP